MTRVPVSLYVGGIAATFLFWLCCWLVLGNRVFGETYDDWDQAAVAMGAALAALGTAWRTPRPYTVFMAIQGLGLIFLAISWVTYDPQSIRLLHFQQAGLPDYSAISYSGFVFSLACAWGYLGLELWTQRPPGALTKAVFSLLFLGLAAILGAFYYPQYATTVNTVAGRLDAVSAGLEFLILLTGLACILLKTPFAINVMLIGTALLIAGDMVYTEDSPPDGIKVVWMAGQFLLLASCLLLSEALHPLKQKAHKPSPHFLGLNPTRSRSDLSGILILLSLGTLLLATALGLVEIHIVWKAFFAVLFVVTLVVGEAWLTDRFDDSVQYLRQYTKHLHRNRLEPADWRTEDVRIQTTLQSTGLGEYLDTLNQSGRELKENVIFLGPERLFPQVVTAHPRGQRSCFIVMPFNDQWSGDVHHVLSAVCKSLGVQPMRGDDVFKPSDFLADIWQSINSAHFVIADISGKNPNVLYELGIAHTLAKPVLIISKKAADIPIDLSTRRAIIYGQKEECWQADLEAKLTQAVREMMDAYPLNA